MGLAEEVEAMFGDECLYAALGLSNDASPGKIKQAYFSQAKRVHPDKVSPSDREEATKKFQTLGAVYKVLSDPDRRKAYDETGSVDEDDAFGKPTDMSWAAYWRATYCKVTVADVEQFEAQYKGSDEEQQDLKAAFVKFEGDLDKVFEYVPCSNPLDDEVRFRKLLQKWIRAGDVEPYPCFAKEPKAKRTARRRRAKREAEAAQGAMSDLVGAIQARMKARQPAVDSHFDAMLEKYGGKAEKQKRKGAGSRRGKKNKATHDSSEPPEEAFAQMAKRFAANKANR
eukprot:m.17166 g.17166  ORF g.17166 m.17166 type:complete len:284 (+) comp5406_c0_seq2:202-1053(+)